MYSLKNRAFAGVLALLMLLSMTGCAGTTSGEESSGSTVTQEEYDALKEQNEQLQAELDELKGETDEETESDTESGSSSEAESTSTPRWQLFQQHFFPVQHSRNQRQLSEFRTAEFFPEFCACFHQQPVLCPVPERQQHPGAPEDYLFQRQGTPG